MSPVAAKAGCPVHGILPDRLVTDRVLWSSHFRLRDSS